ncbi:MAG: nickel transporter [Proteobacteria bacterium]|nr:MAG: nickel transporter [Pseudomonadota bacterium]PIE65372.1 MAG: nickel transporter [Desulfobacterales bacterium]
MKKFASLMAGAVILGSAAVASAHFQMIYTPEMAMTKGGEAPLKLVFTHPFEAGHTMDMGTPEQFYVVRSRGENEPKKTDLKDTLKPITWTSLTNDGKAWETTYKFRGGDYAFCLIPEPYWEEGDGFYIKQNTKVIVNVGGEPGAWSEPVGMPTEIVPLAKPYDRWTGNVFQGQVLFDGKPVPGAEVEIEFMNHKPMLDKNAFAKEGEVEAPQDAFVLQTIFADENGVFTFGIPRAGWWGFAALDLDPDYQYKGKKCSRDAVIWIQAKDMK